MLSACRMPNAESLQRLSLSQKVPSRTGIFMICVWSAGAKIVSAGDTHTSFVKFSLLATGVPMRGLYCEPTFRRQSICCHCSACQWQGRHWKVSARVDHPSCPRRRSNLRLNLLVTASRVSTHISLLHL